MTLLERAIDYSRQKHSGQWRRGCIKKQAVSHPLACVRILMDEAGIENELVVIAAALHDTLEDTDATYEDLLKRFGKVVADVVLEVTNDPKLGSIENKMRQVEMAPNWSFMAKLVKMADKIANIREIAVDPPKGWDTKKKLDYFEFSKAVVDGMRGVNKGLEAAFDEAYKAKDKIV